MIIDANGTRLTSAMLSYAWAQIPDYQRVGAQALMSRRQLDALLKAEHVSAGLLENGGKQVGGVPIYDHTHVQDDAVFLYSRDFLHQLVMIKNVAAPPKEPE